MKVKFLGHACVEVDGSKRIYVDPFLTDNPAAAIGWQAIWTTWWDTMAIFYRLYLMRYYDKHKGINNNSVTHTQSEI